MSDDRRHFARLVSAAARLEVDAQQIVLTFALADGTNLELPLGPDAAETVRDLLTEALSDPEVAQWKRPARN